MTLIEDLAKIAYVEGDLVDLSGLHEDLAIPSFPKPRATYVVDDQNRTPVRVYVSDAHDEISITRGRGNEEFRTDFAGPFDRGCQRVG